MKITILTVGKIKEDFYRKAIEEYSKRLSRYCKLEIIEVTDEKTPDSASAVVEEQIKDKEYVTLIPDGTLPPQGIYKATMEEYK